MQTVLAGLNSRNYKWTNIYLFPRFA
ncbi:MAG: hypothetical protein RL274_2770, partial [Pseudomonadota bacterium]